MAALAIPTIHATHSHNDGDDLAPQSFVRSTVNQPAD